MPAPDELLHDGVIDFDGTYYYDGETFHRLREYEYELDVLPMRYRNASAVRRPDAISSDYLTAFSIGPRDQGDLSGDGGILNRVWRIRVVGQTVMISRANGSFHGQ